MDLATIFDDFFRLYDGFVGKCGSLGDPGEKAVRYWSKTTGLPIETLLNQIARHLAKGYLDGSYEWGFCDSIANHILFSGLTDFGLNAESEDGLETWWAVYLAFDASEVAPNPELPLRRELEQILAKL